MKLIYFVQYFPPEKASGLQLVEDLLEGFTKQGWEVELFTPTPTRGITAEQREEFIKKRIEKKYDGKLTIHRMHLYREGKGFISRAVRYLIFSIECFWKAVTVPADYIFTGSGPPTQGVVVGLAKKIARKKKVIYNLQDIFPDSLVTSGICSEKSVLMKIGHALEHFTYRNADLIITITDEMKANILKKGVSPDKVKVIQNWIDVDTIKPIAPENNNLYDELMIDRNKFNVVYAGNIGKVQGVDVVTRAAEQLLGHKDIHFLIFGNGSEEETIKQQAKNLTNISIFPLQPIERVSEVYSLGDVSIISCRPGTGGSGMPSKTWTIMATGTAVIASFDLGGEMEKVINQAKCGYCIEAGNSELLVETIISMKYEMTLTKQMGENARKYAERYIAKDPAVQKYVEIISDV